MGKYYIFGAHSRGKTLGVYLKTLDPEAIFLGYLYDNDEDNSKAAKEANVYKLHTAPQLDTEAYVYIATRGIFFDVIEKELRDYGFTNIIRMTPDLDINLRNAFIEKYFKENNRDFIKIESVSKGECTYSDVAIYVVRSAADKVLEKEKALRDFEFYIQAGKALTYVQIADCCIFDDTGDNISARNKQMCELTAMYWIWNNSEKEIVGLEHYRRRFILPDNWSSSLAQFDVILPTPLYVSPSLKENYCERHLKYIWDVMMETIKKISGDEYYESACAFFERTGAYSPCNMLIAKKQVFDDMCKFIFPIIFEVVEQCGEVDDQYQNRYPGFLAERLITFFYYVNSKKYKVLYCDKNFIS